MDAYRALGPFSIGLPNGEILHMRPAGLTQESGDLVPPSFAQANPHQVAQWLCDGNVVLVTNVKRAELERADLAAGYAQDVALPDDPDLAELADGSDLRG